MVSIIEAITKLLVLITTLVGGISPIKPNISSTTTTYVENIQPTVMTTMTTPVVLSIETGSSYCNSTNILVAVRNDGTEDSGPVSVNVYSPTGTSSYCYISNIKPAEISYCVISRNQLVDIGYYRIIARGRNSTSSGVMFCATHGYGTPIPGSTVKTPSHLILEPISYCTLTNIVVSVRNDGEISSGPVAIAVISPTQNVFVGCTISDIPPGGLSTCSLPRGQILTGSGYYKIVVSSSTSNSTGVLYCVG
jgi:hypothetical protein